MPRTTAGQEQGQTPSRPDLSTASNRAEESARVRTIDSIIAGLQEMDSGTDADGFLNRTCELLSHSGLYKSVWGRLLNSTPDHLLVASHNDSATPPGDYADGHTLYFAPCVQQALQGASPVMLPQQESDCHACPLNTDCGGTDRIMLGLTRSCSVHGVLSISLFPGRRLAEAEVRSLRSLAETVATRLDSISDLRRLQASGSDIPDLYRTVFEYTGTAMWIADDQGIVRLVNRRFESMTGYRRVDVEGKFSWEDLFPKEDVPSLRDVRTRRLSGVEVPEQFEARLLAKDGTMIPVLNTSSRIPHSNSILTSLMDLTQERRAVQAQRDAEARAQQTQRLAAIGEMAAGVAHEINNPVTGIIGFADMLRQQPLRGEAVEYASLIMEAGQRVANIVEQLLSFAREKPPARTPVDLNRLVENTARIKEPRMAADNVKLVLALDESLPPVLADAGQLNQVITNIAANAHVEMHLAHGGGTLTISSRRLNNSALLEFEDNGPGIEREYLDRVFDPFFTTREVGQGTGLGLSICHGIVAEHAGRIGVRNNSTGGATFTVEIPLAQVHSRRSHPTPTEP